MVDVVVIGVVVMPSQSWTLVTAPGVAAIVAAAVPVAVAVVAPVPVAASDLPLLTTSLAPVCSDARPIPHIVSQGSRVAGWRYLDIRL